MKSIRAQLRYVFCALGYFTRVPIPAWVGYRPDDLNHAAKYFPLIGILVGAVGAAVFWGSSCLVSQRVAVVLSMIATVWLTGGFHEDGLADSLDGFGGGYTREDVLRIMQDSRIGSFGALGLVLVLLLKLELLAGLPRADVPWALIAAHGASRFTAVAYLASLDYVRSDGKAKPLATRLSRVSLVFAAVSGLSPLFYFEFAWAGIALAVLAAAHLALRRYFVRRLGGYSGDALGFAQQVFEACIYLSLAAWTFF